ncbi:MAG: FMN-binding protein [archaeon]
MRDTIHMIAVLVTVTIFSAAVLTYVNEITQPRIIENRDNEVSKALSTVLPDATGFREIQIEGDAITKLYEGDDEGRVGWVIIAEGIGFADTIELAIGVDPDYRVTGVVVLDQKETPGLGARITEPAFLAQFVGEMGDIDAITGASISSDAATAIVRSALSELREGMS